MENSGCYIEIKNGTTKALLDVIFYRNDGCVVAFAPALDLMGYGKTEDEAKASFEVVLDDFLETTQRLGTLDKYLVSHGWSSSATEVSYRQPEPVKLLQSNVQFRDVFASDFHKKALSFNYAMA